MSLCYFHSSFQRNSNKRRTKMASHVIYISSMLMAFLLLINGSFGRPSTKIASNELNEICSTTQDPLFCVQVLNADPRTANANLKGLA